MNLMMRASALLSSILLTGCGLSVPPLQEPWGTEDSGKQMVRRIVRGVYCEIEYAVNKIIDGDKDSAPYHQHHARKADWLGKWGAQITLTLTIDESSSFSPGVTFKSPIYPAFLRFPGIEEAASIDQGFSLGVGGNASASSQRINKVNLYFTVAEMQRNFAHAKVCQRAENGQTGFYSVSEEKDAPFAKAHDDPHASDFHSPILMQSNLGIHDWLKAAIFAEQIASEDFLLDVSDGGPENAVQHQVSFKVVTAGGIAPSWNLVRVSAPNNPLFGVARERTHDLLITFGPDKGEVQRAARAGRPTRAAVAPSSKKVAVGRGLDESAANLHFSSQIGQAISQSLLRLR